jgi:hypothetical protein
LCDLQTEGRDVLDNLIVSIVSSIVPAVVTVAYPTISGYAALRRLDTKLSILDKMTSTGIYVDETLAYVVLKGQVLDELVLATYQKSANKTIWLVSVGAGLFAGAISLVFCLLGIHPFASAFTGVGIGITASRISRRIIAKRNNETRRYVDEELARRGIDREQIEPGPDPGQ